MFQTNYNAKNSPGQFFSKPSLTVPDESYTIKEILERSQKGLIPNIRTNPRFDVEANEDMDFEQISLLRTPGLDITEVQQFADEINERLTLSQKNQIEQQKQKAIEKKAIEKQKLREEILKEMEKKD